MPSPWLILATLAGGTIAARIVQRDHCYLDRDIDEDHEAYAPAPASRPPDVPAGAAVRLHPGRRIVPLRNMAVNVLAASLGSAIGFYVFVYTMWLKRSATQNIVIGGAAGAVPRWSDGPPSPGRWGSRRSCCSRSCSCGPAALLGARHALLRRLRLGRRPHAAGGPRRCGDAPADPHLLARPVRDDPRPRARRWDPSTS